MCESSGPSCIAQPREIKCVAQSLFCPIFKCNCIKHHPETHRRISVQRECYQSSCYKLFRAAGLQGQKGQFSRSLHERIKGICIQREKHRRFIFVPVHCSELDSQCCNWVVTFLAFHKKVPNKFQQRLCFLWHKNTILIGDSEIVTE